MIWKNNKDAWTQSSETVAGSVHVFYWLTTVVAGLIVILVADDFFMSWAQGYPILSRLDRCNCHLAHWSYLPFTDGLDAIKLRLKSVEAPCRHRRPHC